MSNSVFSDYLTFFLSFYNFSIADFLIYRDTTQFPAPEFFRIDDGISSSSLEYLEYFISPSILHVGFTTRSRTQKPTCEFYHPSVYDRQLKLGQVPPHLFLFDHLKPRQPIKTLMDAQLALSIADQFYCHLLTQKRQQHAILGLWGPVRIGGVLYQACQSI